MAKKPTCEELKQKVKDLEKELAKLKHVKQELHQSEQELSIRNRIADIFLTIPDEEMYAEVLQVVLEAVESKYGVFGYINQDGALVCPSMTRDVWSKCQIPNKDIVFSRKKWGGSWGRALAEKKAFRVNNHSPVPQGHIRIFRQLALPIIHQKDVIGLLHVANKATDYNEDDETLLKTIAEHIAPILAARLQRDRKEAARKGAEMELDKHRWHLEELVKERTVKLKQANKQLEQEIAERKLAEEALRESEGKLRSVFDNMQDVFYRADSEGRVVWVSPSAVEMLGYESTDELIGRNLAEEFYEDPEKRKGFLQELLQKGRVSDYEVELRKRDGSTIVVSTNSYYCKNERGEIIGVEGTCRDITVRKRTEKELQRQHQIQSVLNAMLSLSMKPYSLAKILDCILEQIVSIPWLTLEAKGAIFLVGNTPDVLNMTSWRGLTKQQQACAQVPFGKCLCGRAASTRKVQFTSSVDKRHEFLSKEIAPHGHYCVPIISSKKVLGVLNLYAKEGHIYNKDKEDILKTIANVLAGIIERKQAEIKLQQTLKELAQSNAELQHFGNVASHDLQEPLRMIASYLQILQHRHQDKFDTHAEKCLAYALDGATRMQALIHNLLEYSRLGTHGQPLAPTECQAILLQVLANLQATIEKSGAKITYNHLPTIIGDNLQLAQLFQNLITNAIKFKREEPPHIHICAKQDENEWVFSVRDNGIGIAAEFYDRIFIMFQRLHSRAEYFGTGIGLAICKKIVERHGGHIWLSSTIGKGTTFYFTIPAIRR